MAKYTGTLTDKQKEMLAPLEEEIKDIMREREKLRKIQAFKQSIGFEENIENRKKIDAIDERHAELSRDISEIYGAQAEIAKHMKVVLDEIKVIDNLCNIYGVDLGR